MKVVLISRPTLFTTPGGDTVQIKQTACELVKLGVEVDIKLADEEINYENYDLLHFFNIIRPNAITAHVKQANKPFVISTIFVDYSEIEKKIRGSFFKVLSTLFGADGTDYLKTLGRFILNGESIIDSSYLYRGHQSSIEELLNSSSLLLPNSMNEFFRLKERYDFRNIYIKVPNGVADVFFEQPLKVQKEDIVLCIGRIEFIKNQLNLIKALSKTDIPLYIIGKPAPNHQHYFDLCKQLASDNIHFLGYLNQEEIISWLDRAKVHVLPSWFETTGLSTMEAIARQCNVVITRKGDTVEYFDDLAYYCDPSKPKSIKMAIEKALRNPINEKLINKVKETYRWSEAAKKTKEAYLQVLNKN